MANREPSRAFAEEVYASCLTIGFANDDVRDLKALLDAAGVQDQNQLIALALRAQTASSRWALSGKPMSR